MNRSFSYPAQFVFDRVNGLQTLTTHPNRIVRLYARATNRFAKLLLRRVGAGRLVRAHLYGHSLVMPAEHPLPMIQLIFPQYNRPLGMAMEAIAASSKEDSGLAVIDVGANIGETVAILEERVPGVCSYLCIEADRDIAELCAMNHTGKGHVQVEQSFVGEDEGALVRLADDGRSNPTTELVAEANADDLSSFGRLVRLDTIARPFAEAHGRLDLIKVDTEGYDFSVLRSGSELLHKYRPGLYFEWFPKLLIGMKEDPSGGFEYLEKFAYRHFVFFSSQGDLYCRSSNPDRSFLRSLASVALGNESLLYFDVFASTSEEVSDKLVDLATTPAVRQMV
jgi:FkbM family methyltransferase